MTAHRIPPSLSALALVLALPGAALAQGGVFLNEIYASHAGTDNLEFIELVGTPGLSLDGHVVLVVEGDGLAAGTLDRVWDLTGNSLPADGYFVLGDDLVPNLDFSIGASNAIENGTDTFYLVSTSDPSALTALLGTNLDPDGDLATTIPGLATILDLVGLVDDGYGAGTDFVFDGAAVLGPDGSFLPAGIFRGLDYPDPWCPDSFLDFDPAVNLDEPTTPGAQNVNCDSQVNSFCVAQVNSQGCTPVVTTTGTPSASAGSGFDVAGSQLRANSFAILAYGTSGTAATPFGNGTLCLAPTVNRTTVQNTGGSGPCGGTTTLDFNALIASGVDPALVAGQDVFAQYWSRDSGDAFGSNLSGGVAFNIGL